MNTSSSRIPQSSPLPFALCIVALLVLLLTGCAATAPGGRSQMTMPEPISALYSSLDLNLTLSSLAPVSGPCAGAQCQVDKGFERQAARLGERLAAAAYETYPELKGRVPRFKVTVAEKADAGSSSDASGNIVIYRGVRKASLDEEALAYLIAYEMGRVIARHHDEKSAANVVSSLLAQLLLGPANLARGVAFLATSVASAFGSGLMAAEAAPERLKEADTIALELMSRQGWGSEDVAEALTDYSRRLGKDPWSLTVGEAAKRIAAYKPRAVLALASAE